MKILRQYRDPSKSTVYTLFERADEPGDANASAYLLTAIMHDANYKVLDTLIEQPFEHRYDALAAFLNHVIESEAAALYAPDVTFDFVDSLYDKMRSFKDMPLREPVDVENLVL